MQVHRKFIPAETDYLKEWLAQHPTLIFRGVRANQVKKDLYSLSGGISRSYISISAKLSSIRRESGIPMIRICTSRRSWTREELNAVESYIHSLPSGLLTVKRNLRKLREMVNRSGGKNRSLPAVSSMLYRVLSQKKEHCQQMPQEKKINSLSGFFKSREASLPDRVNLEPKNPSKETTPMATNLKEKTMLLNFQVLLEDVFDMAAEILKGSTNLTQENDILKKKYEDAMKEMAKYRNLKNALDAMESKGE